MRTIIAGTREGCDWDLLCKVIESVRAEIEITEVVSGTACGIDKMGEHIAERLKIPIKLFPADWIRYGKKAGIMRNAQMGNYAQALIALPSKSKSKGTWHMINYATRKGLYVYTYILP